MLVAALQMNSGPDVSVNLASAGQLIEDAVTAGAEILLLPENFAMMPRDEADRVAVAEAAGDGPIQTFLAQQAKARGIWLVAGSVPLVAEAPGRFYAACLVYAPTGERVARYDKIHLFDVDVGDQESYRESDYISPGGLQDNLVSVNTPGARIGLTICYDLRFPELYRMLTANGVTLFTVPAAFTATTGQAHWESLLRARAIENLAYVVASGQSGMHVNGRETFGHSMIIDPWGRIVAALENEQQGFIVAALQQEEQQHLRARFPSLHHRRL